MSATRIATTRSQDLQPLGTAGQTAMESWGALVSLLSRALSPAHARLLAEPMVNPARGEVDWYAEGEDEAVPLPNLPAAEQERVRAELDRQTADIAALADRMHTSRAEGERFLADMLGFAMQVPTDAYVRVRNGHPVLVAWGHALASPAAPRVFLTGQSKRPARPMTILPPPSLFVPPGLSGARLAALLAALLLALLVLLLALYLVLRDPFRWYAVDVAACTVAPGQLELQAALKAEDARSAALRTELARLTDEAGRRRLQCPPIAVPPPTGDTQRAQARGAQRGKLQIILAWDDRNDLDLHVACPDDREIIYYDRRTACGGTLDVDANGDERLATATPVESVFFPDPAPGRYRVIVDPYAMRVSQTSLFRVTVKREGQPDQVFNGTAVNGQRNQEITVVEVPAP
jgi:hypothetical protein